MRFSLSRRAFLAVLTLAGVPVASQAADDPFAQYVRQTQPLTPAEAQKAFHLPPGFEIQLVAAEPDIAKPMNIAFDSRGRLWMTQSKEYPFPAPQGKNPTDAIK